MFKNYIFLMAFLAILGCNNQTEKKEQPEKVNPIQNNQQTSNNLGIDAPKPMALMMRAMYLQSEALKTQLLNNNKPDSIQYAFLHFHTAEPTNVKVLEPNFYSKANSFQLAYKAIYDQKTPELRLASFNNMVTACINCHEDYCTGPIKKINKLSVKMND